MIRLSADIQAAVQAGTITAQQAQAVASVITAMGGDASTYARIGSTERIQDIAAQIPVEIRQQARDLLGDSARVSGVQIQTEPPQVTVQAVQMERVTCTITPSRNSLSSVETIDETDL